MKRRGWVSPARAASLLDVHRNTVYAWATRALAGEPSRLHHVEQHPITHHIFIAFADIQKIKESSQEKACGACDD
jgi:hypothetical protein